MKLFTQIIILLLIILLIIVIIIKLIKISLKNNFNTNINNITDNTKTGNDFFKEYEKNLMVNLHERNMRRSTSQMETKQSQSSIYLDDNEFKKANTQTKRLLFTNVKDKDKEIINEDYNGNNNDKVKLAF